MKRSKSGFTLAELLIVVAIVAVLAAIAFPLFSKHLNETRLTVDLAHERDVETYIGILESDGILEFGSVKISKNTMYDIVDGKPAGGTSASYYLFLDDGTLSSDMGAILMPTVPDNLYYAQGDGNGHSRGDNLLLVIERTTPSKCYSMWTSPWGTPPA